LVAGGKRKRKQKRAVAVTLQHSRLEGFCVLEEGGEEKPKEKKGYGTKRRHPGGGIRKRAKTNRRKEPDIGKRRT